MGVLKLLTDPGNFKFYWANQKGGLDGGANPNNVNPREIGFGKDRPEGGSSKQPYIKKPIKEDFKNPAFYNDFIVRGGILSLTSAAEDVTRLTKYFTDLSNPSGILFAAKQNILSRTGIKTEANQPTPAYLGGALNEGVYLPTSTLAQVLVGFAGTTLNKQGIDPTGLVPGLAIRDYQTAVYKRNINQPIEYSVAKSVQRKVDKINQNILKKQDQIESTNASFNAQALSATTSAWSQFKERRLNARINNLEGDIEGLQEDVTSIVGGKFSNRLLRLWNKFGLNPDNETEVNNGSTILSYGGGPGSALGFSRTKIKFATSNDGQTPLRTGYVMIDPYEGIGYRNHSFDNLLQYSLDTLFDGKQLKSSVFRQYQIFNPTVTEEQYFGTPEYFTTYNGKDNVQPWLSQPVNNPPFAAWNQSQINAQSANINSLINADFRQALDPTSQPQYTFLSLAPNYQTKNIEDNLNLGNPGRRGNISSYTKGKRSIVGNGAPLGPVDKVNASYIYKANTLTGDQGSRYYTGNSEDGDNPYKDIIPFYIAILNNDSQVGGTYKKYMHFRAFIDSFSDSYDADWKTINYMGRAENFYKYNSFDRKISMAFTIVAQSREEITAMYDKLNFLASSLAPEYLDSYTSGYMAGNIAYITLGDYLHEQPGIITSLTYDVPEEATWEIGIDDEGNDLDVNDVRKVPHMIKITGINFIPLHKFRPEKQNFRNDKLGTDSTRLLSTGKQQYIDQQRPLITNYDRQAQNQFTEDQVDALINEQQAIPLQNTVDTNTLPSYDEEAALLASENFTFTFNTNE